VLVRSTDVGGALESSQVEGDQDLGLRVGGGSIQACGSETTPEKKSREINFQDWPVILQDFCAAPRTHQRASQTLDRPPSKSSRFHLINLRFSCCLLVHHRRPRTSHSSTMAGRRLKYRHLGRTSSHRQALLRNLVTSLFTHESISTTYPKAKEAQRLAEKLITLGKKNTEASKRRALSIFFVRQFPQAIFHSYQGCIIWVANGSIDST
jgi:ribosomal protein L17